MPENKTKATIDSVDTFLDAVEDAQKRADSKAICAMMQEITGEPPVLWRPSIIGFGKYHYKYASGHEGDAPLIGFSPRKQALTLYLLNFDELLAKLGKHKTSKACLYIKTLKDVDQTVLRELIERSYKDMLNADHCKACEK